MTTPAVAHSPIGPRFAEPTATADFALGEIACGEDGSEWVYCQANGAITGAGYSCLIDEDYQADMLDTTNTASAFGEMVGVPAADFADNEYGWFQRKGTAEIRVSASAAANAAINSTATAGQLDDDGTTGAETIDGMVLTTANGGSAALAEGVLNYPTVGATIA